MRRFGWGHAIALTVAVTLVWAGGIVFSGARAAQHPDCAWVRPAQQHQASVCRGEGWLISTPLAVSPHGVVKRSYLPSCTFEDGSGGPLPCSWNFRRHDGNGKGMAYWITKNRVTHYVWARTPVPIREGYAHWPTWKERHHLGLDNSCWVYRTKQHTWNYQCPEDSAPSI